MSGAAVSVCASQEYVGELIAQRAASWSSRVRWCALELSEVDLARDRVRVDGVLRANVGPALDHLHVAVRARLRPVHERSLLGVSVEGVSIQSPARARVLASVLRHGLAIAVARHTKPIPTTLPPAGGITLRLDTLRIADGYVVAGLTSPPPRRTTPPRRAC